MSILATNPTWNSDGLNLQKGEGIRPASVRIHVIAYMYPSLLQANREF